MTSGATIRRHGERKKLVSERQMTRKEVEHVADPGLCFRDGGQEAQEPF